MAKFQLLWQVSLSISAALAAKEFDKAAAQAQLDALKKVDAPAKAADAVGYRHGNMGDKFKKESDWKNWELAPEDHPYHNVPTKRSPEGWEHSKLSRDMDHGLEIVLPPHRQITMKEARQLATELLEKLNKGIYRAAIESERVRKLEAIRFNADQHAPEFIDRKIHAYQIELLVMIHRATDAVTNAWELEGQFHEACVCILEAARRKHDKKLMHMYDELIDISTLTETPNRRGRIQELDDLSDAFLDMSIDERKAAMVETERVMQNETLTTAPKYLEVMKAVMEKGEPWVEDQIIELSGVRHMHNHKGDPIEEHRKELNILITFLRQKDRKHVHDKMEALRESHIRKKGEL